MKKNPRKYKALTYLGLGVVITAWLLLIFIGYEMFYPFNPLEVNEFRIINHTYYQGGELLYFSSYCKYMPMSAKVMTSYNDGVIYPMESYRTNMNVGCGNVTNTIKIPQNLPAGKYTIYRTYEYRINGLRSIQVSVRSNEFEVKNARERV